MPLDETLVNSLPEEIRNEPSFAEISKGDLPGVFKNLIDSQKTLGRAILLPDEKDPEERRLEKLNSVYDKLGRPKTHGEYDYKDVTEKATEYGITEEHLGKFGEIFHQAGLSQSQVKTIVGAYVEHMAGSSLTKEYVLKAVAEGVEGKNNGWGDKTEANLGIAKSALVKFDTDGEFLALLEQSRLGNHPATLRFLHNVGLPHKGDSTPRVEDRAGVSSPAQAQAKIAAIQNDKNHPYHDRSKAGHREAVEEMSNYFKIVHGEKVEAVIGG